MRCKGIYFCILLAVIFLIQTSCHVYEKSADNPPMPLMKIMTYNV